MTSTSAPRLRPSLRRRLLVFLLIGWGLVGLGLLGVAMRKAHVHVRDQEEALRRADAAFAAEEAAPAP